MNVFHHSQIATAIQREVRQASRSVDDVRLAALERIARAVADAALDADPGFNRSGFLRACGLKRSPDE